MVRWMLNYQIRNWKNLKNAVKNKTGTTLRLSLKNVCWKWFITWIIIDKKKLRNAFNNHKSTDLKLSKVQISKIVQSVGFLGSLLSKLVGPLMKVEIPLVKNVLAPLWITAAASAIDAGIQKKYMVLEQQL